MKILFLGAHRPYYLYWHKGIERKRYIIHWYEELWREELFRQCDVFRYGPEYVENFDPDLTVKDIISMSGMDFDIILTSCTHEHFKGFNEVTNIPKVTISKDLYDKAWHMRRNRQHFAAHSYDLLLGYSSLITYWTKKWGWARYFDILPFSIDINAFQNMHLPKVFDVNASMTKRQDRGRDADKVRNEIKQKVKEMDIVDTQKKWSFMDYVVNINQSKIILNYLWQGFFSARYFEVLACGGFLLTDQPKYDLDLVGLEAGKHFATFKGMEDVEEKIMYWLNHDKERERIARQGMRFVRKHHNTKVRVKEFRQKIRAFLSNNTKDIIDHEKI